MKKINKLAILFMAITISLTMFTSCNEEEDFRSLEINKKGLHYTNNKNPFNIFGELHNEILDKMGDSIKSELDTLVKENYISTSSLRSISDSLIHISVNILKDDYEINIDDSTLICDINATVDHMSIADFPINDSIKQIVFRYNNYDSIMSYLCEWEDDLIKQYESGDTSILFDLYDITMFKYSFSYWYGAFLNKTNTWYGFLSAAYINKTLTYVSNKGLFKDIWDGIKSFTSSACSWIGNHIGNIVTCALYTAIGDVIGGAACYYGIHGLNVVAALHGNIPYTAMEIGIGCTVTAFSSVVGACIGWTNPLF